MNKIKTLIKMNFDPQIAKDIGVEEAIMHSNIEFWCDTNEKNNRHIHGGCAWMYNSVEAFKLQFPFWTAGQIRRILDNLLKKKYIKAGNYNKIKYDKTRWFAVLIKSTNI